MLRAIASASRTVCSAATRGIYARRSVLVKRRREAPPRSAAA
jgi:hypothetical protein